MKKIFFFICFICLCVQARGQYAVGDFGSLGSGNWGTTNANWRQWNGAAWATIPAGAPLVGSNVWILAGHTVVVEASTKNCRNLTVETGGKLYTNSTGANRFINVFGNITCDGIIGNGTTFDCLGFNIEGVTCLASGSGSFDASRIRKSAVTNVTTSLTISININLRFGTSSSTQIYNNTGATSNFNVTITSGYTLNLTSGAFSGNASIDGATGTAGANARGTFTVNGTLYVSGILYLKNNNAAGGLCSWIIGSGGLIQAYQVEAGASGTAGNLIRILNGGKLEIFGTPAFSNFSGVNNTYDFQTGSTVEYSAAGNQIVEAIVTGYSNLLLSNSGYRILTGGVATNNLTITGSATLCGGTSNILLGGNWTSYGINAFDENASTVYFIGSGAQAFTCPGVERFYNLEMSGGASTILSLNNSISVKNSLNMFAGIINTSGNTVTIEEFGSTTGASNTSFVSGAVRYIGGNAINYPVGKNTDYQALGISAGTPTKIDFWTETFTNGCASDCLVNTYGGWTETSTGTNDIDNNLWYVSCMENGNGAGECGTGCNGDASLHVSTNSSVVGDQGATYLAGGLGFWSVQTDLRAESPTINCSGRSSITVSLNYMENGDGTTDDGTLWYYDGTTWSLLSNLSKTNICGPSPQGLWVAFSTNLPVSADNNPNVKIGFRWVNNDDNVGTDPSFAIDDIILSAAGSTSDFTAEYFYADPQTTFNNVLDPSLNNISQCEYWTLTRNAGTETKNVTLTWDVNSCGVGSVADLRVAHWDGSVWQNEGNTVTGGLPPPTGPGTVTSGVVTSFSPFTHSSVSAINPLPIELLSFTANYNSNSKVDLKWSTASETNNDYFTIERSVDGIEFYSINVTDGAGNSTSTLNYFTTDNEPLTGVSYYRLKQTDFDGNYSYSSIVSVEKNQNGFEIVNTQFDNSQNQLAVYFNCNNNCTISLELYDLTGKKIYSSIENTLGKNSELVIPINNISEGIYLIKAFNGEKVISKKVKL